MSIHFGTDGWRAVIGEDFTFSNIRRVSQAIADWVNRSNGYRTPSVVVGFDTRFLSDCFAIEVARVLAGNGILVHLTQADAPTPAVSLAIKQLGACGGVMITASHNPPRYNGIKLKASYGGCASNDDCRTIESLLGQDNQLRLLSYEGAQQAGLIQRFDPRPFYYEHLDTLLQREMISARVGRVVVDPMHGAGRDYIRDWVKDTGWQVTQIRGDMNPGFGGVHPEPIMPHLEALRRAVVKDGFAVGLATDGDADRIGAMDGWGRLVDPHCIFALALRYLVEARGWRGLVVKTVSTTRMIDRLCERYQLPLIETQVGFNHITELMLQQDVLIGGEESGGISIKGHIPEGDGILLGLLLLEIIASSGATLAELVDDLRADVGPAHYARQDLALDRPVNKEEITTRLADDAPGKIGGVTVERVQRNDGVKYLMDDGAWLLIRPSGTEPVLRVYAEAPQISAVDALLKFGQTIAAST